MLSDDRSVTAKLTLANALSGIVGAVMLGLSYA